MKTKIANKSAKENPSVRIQEHIEKKKNKIKNFADAQFDPHEHAAIKNT
jgi:hypothetical protein